MLKSLTFKYKKAVASRRIDDLGRRPKSHFRIISDNSSKQSAIGILEISNYWNSFALNTRVMLSATVKPTQRIPSVKDPFEPNLPRDTPRAQVNLGSD
mgnify:CR=1 FL=1